MFDKSFENMTKFKYLRTTANQNCFPEKISTLNSGNACYHSLLFPL